MLKETIHLKLKKEEADPSKVSDPTTQYIARNIG
jgi:hypothetical protein